MRWKHPGSLQLNKMNQTIRDSLSRLVSKTLRHEPESFGLYPDLDGFVPLEDLVAALRRSGCEFARLTVREIEDMVSHALKRRHEIVGGKIRALYGHSIAVPIRRFAAEPPEVLFHGTTEDAISRIQAFGLQPIRRQHVHLSEDVSIAREVALRRRKKCAVFKVDARRAHLDGISFFRGGELVWLAQQISWKYLNVQA
jgi:putative RNA 2'-phosphotransferase